MGSPFDDEWAKCDQGLMNAFGAPYQLIPSPGADPIAVQVDMEAGLSVQDLGERGRSAQRLAGQLVGSMLSKDVPFDSVAAVLVVDGKNYKLTEPIDRGGQVEFLFLPLAAPGATGSKSSTFLSP